MESVPPDQYNAEAPSSVKRDLPGYSSTPDSSSNVDSAEPSVSKRSKIEKYNLRRSSLVKRIEVEEKIKLPKEPKPKVKPPPLSKYRRKSANARERTRMSDMNLGYEQLQAALPAMGDSSKITKLTLLRLAMNYIKSLQDVLGYSDGVQPTSNIDSSGGSIYSSSGDEAGSVIPQPILAESKIKTSICSHPSEDSSKCFVEQPKDAGFFSATPNFSGLTCDEALALISQNLHRGHFSVSPNYSGSSGDEANSLGHQLIQSGHSSGASNYSSSSGDESSFSPVSDFFLSDGCTDDLMNLNLDELLP